MGPAWMGPDEAFTGTRMRDELMRASSAGLQVKSSSLPSQRVGLRLTGDQRVAAGDRPRKAVMVPGGDPVS